MFYFPKVAAERIHWGFNCLYFIWVENLAVRTFINHQMLYLPKENS